MLISCVYNSERDIFATFIVGCRVCFSDFFARHSESSSTERRRISASSSFAVADDDEVFSRLETFFLYFLDLLEFSIFVCVFICVLQWRQRQKCQNDTRAYMCRTDDVMRAARGNFSFKYLSNTRRRCSSLLIGISPSLAILIKLFGKFSLCSRSMIIRDSRYKSETSLTNFYIFFIIIISALFSVNHDDVISRMCRQKSSHL